MNFSCDCNNFFFCDFFIELLNEFVYKYLKIYVNDFKKLFMCVNVCIFVL